MCIGQGRNGTTQNLPIPSSSSCWQR